MLPAISLLITSRGSDLIVLIEARGLLFKDLRYTENNSKWVGSVSENVMGQLDRSQNHLTIVNKLAMVCCHLWSVIFRCEDQSTRKQFTLGTCEASRFYSNSNRTIPIRFKSNGPIQNFRISRTCRRTTNHAHCSTKNFNRCTVVIEIYFMFMILYLCSKSIHTR